MYFYLFYICLTEILSILFFISSCTIDAGHFNDIFPALKISCPKNKFYKNFVVLLQGGKGSKVLFKTRPIEGQTGSTWTKEGHHIPLFSGGSLSDTGYSIYEVFSDTESTWWSDIQVLPVYPIYLGISSVNS